MLRSPLLKLDRVTYRYPGTRLPVIQDFSWVVSEPGLVLIQGPNMSGKTTLLRILAGDLKAVDGLISAASPLEWVPQDYGEVLFPWKTVAWNIALPLCIASDHTTPVAVCKSALSALPILGEFADFWDTYPSRLSGGAQHLIALARGFAAGARVLLLDEPFTGLDAHRVAVVVETIRAYLATDVSRLVVLVTHQLPAALPLLREYRIGQKSGPLSLEAVEN
jgi:ABC-type nitrate/sulfonate/bicarbonate transport system ATPase subunit